MIAAWHRNNAESYTAEAGSRPKTAAERAARLRKILKILDQMYPHPTVPLHHRDCWELLVATILSAQCTDKRVNEVTPGLFQKYPTIQDFASANQAELALAIRSTGFFNNKAKSLIGAARKILADFGGEIPKTMDEMLTIPGAARKTANVVLGGCYNVHAGDRGGHARSAQRAAAGSDQEHQPGEDRAGSDENHPAREMV